MDVIRRVESAYLRSLNFDADDRTPLQHFTYFCLRPQSKTPSLLAEIIGWARAADYAEKIITRHFVRTPVSTVDLQSNAAQSEVKLSRRAKAKAEGKTKYPKGKSKSQDAGQSDGGKSENRCSTSTVQQPDPKSQDLRPITQETAYTLTGRCLRDAKFVAKFEREVPRVRDQGKRTAPSLSSTSSKPARKIAAVQASAQDSSSAVPAPPSAVGTSTCALTDEDFVDIIRIARRVTDPWERGRIVSSIIEQCKGARKSMDSEEQYMHNLRAGAQANKTVNETPSRQAGPTIEPRHTGLPPGRRSAMSSAELAMKPAYRYLRSGLPPGCYDFGNQGD